MIQTILMTFFKSPIIRLGASLQRSENHIEQDRFRFMASVSKTLKR